MALIDVDNLAVSVAGKTLLDSLSFALDGGEVLAVCGPNGAGKSTLLKCLASERRPTAGSISLDGCPLAALSRAQRARRMAVLPQHSRVPFEFLAREIVEFGLLPRERELSGSQRRRIVDSAMRQTECLELAVRNVATLSGGELQRVQLARVLAQIHAPDGSAGRVLLLDEPTASLDLRHQLQTLEVARQVAREGAAVLVILHDLNLALTTADRVLVLSRGRLEAAGAPRQVLDSRLIRRVFGVDAGWAEEPGSGLPVMVPQLRPGRPAEQRVSVA